MKRLPLYLSRQRNDQFCLTFLPPVYEEVGKSGEQDVYIAYGDPVGWRNVCPWFVSAFLKIDPLPPFGEPVKVWLAGGPRTPTE